MPEPLPGYNLSLGPEMKLMLVLARPRTGDEREKELKGLLGAAIDWSVFLRLCSWHGLFPLVHRNLTNLPRAAATIPPEITAALARSFRDNAIRMTGLGGEIVRLTGLLAGAGVRALPLKGPVAALRIFGDVSLRKSSDIDLLVAPENLLRAVGILSGVGYETAGYPGVCTPEQLRRIVRHGHHFPPLCNAARRIYVELHWKVSSLLPDSVLDFDELWKDADIVDWRGHSLRFLAPEAAFLTMAVHGAHHGWAQLRWLGDIAALLAAREPLDGEKILGEARKLGVTDIVLQALILADLFFGVPLPTWVEGAVSRGKKARKLAQMAAAFITAPPETAKAALFDSSFGISHPLYWAVKRYNMALCSTFPRKAANLLHSFAPSAETVEWAALPDSLFFLYYPLHLFFWFRRRVVRGL
jgi:hypothetical protein